MPEKRGVLSFNKGFNPEKSKKLKITQGENPNDLVIEIYKNLKFTIEVEEKYFFDEIEFLIIKNLLLLGVNFSSIDINWWKKIDINWKIKEITIFN